MNPPSSCSFPGGGLVAPGGARGRGWSSSAGRAGVSPWAGMWGLRDTHGTGEQSLCHLQSRARAAGTAETPRLPQEQNRKNKTLQICSFSRFTESWTGLGWTGLQDHPAPPLPWAASTRPGCSSPFPAVNLGDESRQRMTSPALGVSRARSEAC